MSEFSPAQCWGCVHRIEPANIAEATVARCTAYPDAIPPDILGGEPHETARGDEQGGVTFAAADDADSAYYLAAWRSYRQALTA